VVSKILRIQEVMNRFIRFTEQVIQYFFASKQQYELRYWKSRYKEEGYTFENSYYRKLMLGIAQEENDNFLKDKIVGDFGCGPRGSLAWAKQAAMRIGIDVLAKRYVECFPTEHLKHQMIYLASTETSIPLPDESLDVLYTVNALDHVAHLEAMCSEMRRVLKRGGLLIGSYNLQHKPTKAEPQKLTEQKLKRMLFNGYEILSWRLSAPGNAKLENIYSPFYSNRLLEPGTGPSILWAKAQKV
jgi:SAM-dependent methyltransferase